MSEVYGTIFELQGAYLRGKVTDEEFMSNGKLIYKRHNAEASDERTQKSITILLHEVKSKRAVGKAIEHIGPVMPEAITKTFIPAMTIQSDSGEFKIEHQPDLEFDIVRFMRTNSGHDQSHFHVRGVDGIRAMRDYLSAMLEVLK